MNLVDSSILIALIRGTAELPVDRLVDCAACGPVLQEILQALQPGPATAAYRRALLAMPRMSDPMPASLYLQAAEIFRLGRANGFSIRSSTDCLIAAIAIENQATLLHRDRDFEAIARFTALDAIFM